MKSMAEYRDFVETILIPEIKGMESVRKRTGGAPWLGALLLGLVLTAAYLARSVVPGLAKPLEALPPPLATFSVLVLGVVLLALLSFGLRAKLARDFAKRNIVAQIADFLFPEVEYNKSRHVDQRLVEESLLLDHGDWSQLLHFGGDDFFKGVSKALPFQCSEIEVSFKSSLEGQPGPWRHNGLFFSADLKAPFKGITLVLPAHLTRKTAQGPQVYSPALAKLVRGGKTLEKTAVADMGFDKRFMVFASDSFEAQNILSPGLRQRILKAMEKTRSRKSAGGVFVAFHGQKIYFFLDTGPLFEPDLSKPLDNFSAFKDFYDDLEMVFGLVDDVNANAKLWSHK